MIAWVWELRLENASVLVLNLGIPSWWLQSESIFATMFGSDSHRVCVRVLFLFFWGGETCLQTSLRGQDLGNLRLGIYLEHCRLWELLLGFLRLGIFMPTNARSGAGVIGIRLARFVPLVSIHWSNVSHSRYRKNEADGIRNEENAVATQKENMFHRAIHGMSTGQRAKTKMRDI